MRTHGWSVERAGVLQGVLTMTVGVVGALAGGRVSDALVRRGRTDGPLLVGAASALAMLVFAGLYPLVGSPTLAAALLVPVNLFAAMPWGPASAAMAEVMPARMRGQGAGVMLLVVNLVSGALGPTAVALATERLFGGPASLRYGLSLVTAVGMAIAASLLLAARAVPGDGGAARSARGLTRGTSIAFAEVQAEGPFEPRRTWRCAGARPFDTRRPRRIGGDTPEARTRREGRHWWRWTVAETTRFRSVACPIRIQSPAASPRPPAAGDPAGIAVRVTLVAAALWALRRQLAGVDLGDLVRQLRAYGLPHLGLAVACAAASFLVLGVVELLALRRVTSVGAAAVPRRAALTTAFVANALSQSVGLALTGAAVRARSYARHGLDAVAIARVTAFVTLTATLGLLAAGGAALVHGSGPLHVGMAGLAARPLGALLLAIVGVYVAWSASGRGRRGRTRSGGCWRVRRRRWRLVSSASPRSTGCSPRACSTRSAPPSLAIGFGRWPART